MQPTYKETQIASFRSVSHVLNWKIAAILDGKSLIGLANISWTWSAVKSIQVIGRLSLI